MLSNGQRLHIHKTNPSQDELDTMLLEYERRVLDDVNIGGDDGTVVEPVLTPEDLLIGP